MTPHRVNIIAIATHFVNIIAYENVDVEPIYSKRESINVKPHM